MLADAAAPAIERGVPRTAILVAIPVGFAVLGYVLRLLAYLKAGWEPHLSAYPDGLCRWDCQWYVNLAKEGYDAFPVPSMIDAGNWAFFPLFPLIVGSIRAVTMLPVMNIASAVSIALSSVAAFVAWPLLERNMRAYTLYCAFLLCGPVSIYFTTFFTEVLFILLTNCVLLALRRSNYLAAGALAGLLSATRIVGVFIALAIALQYLLDYRSRGGTLRGFPLELWRRPEIVLALLLAPLGCFAYMAYLHFYMGDALAFSHVQRAWGRVPGNPLIYLWIGLTDFPKVGVWPSANQWLGISALGGIGLSVVLAVQRKYAEALFCLVCLVVPLSAGMASMLRFVVALSPIVLLAMTLLGRLRPVFLLTLLAFVAGDYFFTVGWLEGWLPLSSEPLTSRRTPLLAAWRALLLLLILAVATGELYVAWLALHPRVNADYRAYYIDQTTTCLDKPVAGKYDLGSTVSFMPDDQRGARRLRVCGWDGPAGDGTHSVGTTARLRFAVIEPTGDLILRMQMSAVVAPNHPEQHIVLTAGNGTSLGDATIPGGTMVTVDFRVPDKAIDHVRGRLDVIIAFPTAAEMTPRDSDTHYRSIKLLSVQLRRPGDRPSEGPQDDPAAQRYHAGPD